MHYYHQCHLQKSKEARLPVPKRLHGQARTGTEFKSNSNLNIAYH